MKKLSILLLVFLISTNSNSQHLYANDIEDAINKLNERIDLLSAFNLFDYLFSVENQLITASSTNSDYPTLKSYDLADIMNTIQETRIDPFKHLNGSTNVSMYLTDGTYNSYDEIVFKGGYPKNTEESKNSVSIIGEDHITTSIRLNRPNLGKDVLTFTDGLRINIQNFTISAQIGNGKALYLKSPSKNGGFSVRDSRIDNIYTHHRTDGFSVVMENMFSVICPRIRIANYGGSGLWLYNNSTLVNYGNCLFGKTDISSSGNKDTVGVEISTLEGSGHIMNLLNMEYLEVGSLKGEGRGSDSKGIYFKDTSNINIGTLVSEYLGENIHFDNVSNLTAGIVTVTIEKALLQEDGESYGVKLDNCSNVKLLNGNYYTTDYTTRPLIVNDNPYKHGNVIYGELKNGLNTNSIDDENKINTEVHMFQNGTLDDVTTP